MKIKIAYLKEHQEQIIVLGQWSFETWSIYNPQTTLEAQIEKFKGHCNIDTVPLTLIALNENNNLIGMCSLRETDGIRPDLTPWLGSLYVVLTAHKQGVGEKLIEAIKRVAKNMNFDVLYLFTFDAGLNNYYTKYGWSLIGKDRVNNFPVSIMDITPQ